jgi:plasmid stability protein
VQTAGDHENPVSVMNEIVIRNLDDEILQRLKQLAWQDGRTPADMAKGLLIEMVRNRAARRPMAMLEPQS